MTKYTFLCLILIIFSALQPLQQEGDLSVDSPNIGCIQQGHLTIYNLILSNLNNIK